MNTQKILIIFTLIVGLLAAGCVPISPVAVTPADAPTPPLQETGWILESLNGQPALGDVQVTLNFADGSLGGSDGCNVYGGSYTTDGQQINVGEDLVSTMMACAEPIMEQAAAYFAALAGAATYAVNDAQLTLLDADGAILAAFRQQNRELSGTVWTVTGYNNGQQAVVGVTSGTELTVAFGADGRVSGQSGCNSFSAAYTVTDGGLEIGPAASTRMACMEPAGVMEQEARFLAALESVATYQMDGDRLDLRTAEDALAVSLTR